MGGVNSQTERQIDLLLAARDRTQALRFQTSHGFATDHCHGHATEAAALVRRALSIGNLPRLARTLRKCATAPYGYTERGRASCAILALAIEAIIARRPKPKPRAPRSGSKMAAASSAQIDQKPARKPRIAVDNRVDGELIVCAHCGKEFPAKGRNRNFRIYCSPKCTNKAWSKAHPRRAA